MKVVEAISDSVAYHWILFSCWTAWLVLSRRGGEDVLSSAATRCPRQGDTQGEGFPFYEKGLGEGIGEGFVRVGQQLGHKVNKSLKESNSNICARARVREASI